MSAGRFAMFLTTVLAIWTLMHLYAFARMVSVPWIASHISRCNLMIIAGCLWASYPLARFMYAWHWPGLPLVLEAIGTVWIGTLFLIFSSLLVTDVLTLGGFAVPRFAPLLRGWAMLGAGVLAVIGLVQGIRAPVLRDYEVQLAGLPKDYDGLVLVEISDLHLGTLLGQRWAERMVQRVNALKPELIVVDGDVIDGNVDRVEPLVPTLKKLRAPLGVWAVTGNHEYYAGLRDSIDLFQRAGFTVLEDRSTKVVPGLTIAGVDDLTARQGDGHTAIAVQKALSNRPAGATIYLSHSPLQAPAAAAAGAGLMICGHTHNGQIWPFNYLVHTRYAYMAGRYQVGNMSLIVCRGTGTWGPRMRLWWPSEIVRIKLRSTS
jgi:predicted MPP superfamily phosphohydrolase